MKQKRAVLGSQENTARRCLTWEKNQVMYILLFLQPCKLSW